VAKRGAIMALVKQHLTKEPDEIIGIANSQGLTLTHKQIMAARTKLKRQGFKPKPLKLGRRQPSAPRAASEANGGASSNPKHAELRRLIFEMGFDAARSIFEEFQAMHARMR
jgi:hypothetical protein